MHAARVCFGPADATTAPARGLEDRLSPSAPWPRQPVPALDFGASLGRRGNCSNSLKRKRSRKKKSPSLLYKPSLTIVYVNR